MMFIKLVIISLYFHQIW